MGRNSDGAMLPSNDQQQSKVCEPATEAEADLLSSRSLLYDLRLGAAQGGLLPRPQFAVQLEVARRHQDALPFHLRARALCNRSTMQCGLPLDRLAENHHRKVSIAPAAY